MRFTVTWRTDAEDKLNEIWQDSPADRNAIQHAADEIDRTLRQHADSMGRPWFGGRMLWIEPLVVLFDVSPSDRLVKVWDVWKR